MRGPLAGRQLTLTSYANDWLVVDDDHGKQHMVSPTWVRLDDPEITFFEKERDRASRTNVGSFWVQYHLVGNTFKRVERSRGAHQQR